MKMKKPKFVVLRGRPTSGKSTAFDNLKKKKELSGWVFIDHPKIKSMFNGLPDKEKKEIQKKALFGLVKEVMKNKKNIIMEETSRKNLEKNIGNYLKKYGYKVIIFQFTVSTKRAYNRDKTRVANSKHSHNTSLDIKRLYKFHDERFDKNALLVDTNKLGKRKVVEFILEKLKWK